MYTLASTRDTTFLSSAAKFLPTRRNGTFPKKGVESLLSTKIKIVQKI